MREKLEEKTIELIDKAGANLDSLTAALTEIGQQYGPEVVDVGLSVARVSAGGNLIIGFVLIGLSYMLFRLFGKRFMEAWDERLGDNNSSFWACGGAFGLLGSIVFAVLGCIHVFEIWNWAGVVEPKLWIAHRVLGW